MFTTNGYKQGTLTSGLIFTLLTACANTLTTACCELEVAAANAACTMGSAHVLQLTSHAHEVFADPDSYGAAGGCCRAQQIGVAQERPSRRPVMHTRPTLRDLSAP